MGAQMNDKQLRSKLIRLAHAKPELRADLLPLLAPQAKQAADDPKSLLQEDSDKYFAKYVVPLITKKGLSDALKGTQWSPRGKGALNKQRGFLELLLDHKPKAGEKTKLAMRTVIAGSDYTKGDGRGYVRVEGRHGPHDTSFKMSGNPDQDAKKLMSDLKELVEDYQSFDK